MTQRNDVIIVLTTKFTVKGPTDDELIKLATDAGTEGDDPTEAELDTAYENWKDALAEKYENGEEPPDTAQQDLDMEEVYK